MRKLSLILLLFANECLLCLTSVEIFDRIFLFTESVSIFNQDKEHFVLSIIFSIVLLINSVVVFDKSLTTN